MEDVYIERKGPCICGGFNLDMTEVGVFSTRIGLAWYLQCRDCHRTYRAAYPEYGDEDNCEEYYRSKLVPNAVVFMDGDEIWEPYVPIIFPHESWWKRVREKIVTWTRR